MYLPNFRAYITMQDMARTYPYNNETVLTLQVTNPEATLPDNRRAQRLISANIHLQVNLFCRYVGQTLYRKAIADYKFAKQNGFPFHPYQAVLNYTVPYNGHCHMSAYRDRYEFTGGAHGLTTRYSDTWDLQTGTLLPLSSFFNPGTDVQHILTEQIIVQADGNMQQNPYLYFSDYHQLIEQNFDENHYYLTSAGVAIYYQQYEIAPYATGIVVFIIPYSTLGWQPNCSNPTSYS